MDQTSLASRHPITKSVRVHLFFLLHRSHLTRRASDLGFVCNDGVMGWAGLDWTGLGRVEYVLSTLDKIANWARQGSMWPMTFGKPLGA